MSFSPEINLTKFNQLVNKIHHARSWEQMVDHFLSWIHQNFDQCICIYANVLPDSNNQINWIAQVPKFSSIPKDVIHDFSAFVPLFTTYDLPILTFDPEHAAVPRSITGWLKTQKTNKLSVCPVISQKDVIGLFIFIFPEKGLCSPVFEDPIFFQTLSILFSTTVDLQFRVSLTEQKIQEMDQFIKIGLDLTESLNLEETLNTILEKALSFSKNANNAHVFLYENEMIYFGAAMYKDGSKGRVFSNPRKNGLTYTVARNAEIILVPDMSAHPLYKDTPEFWTGSIIGIPVMNHDTVVGVMTLAKLTPISFTQDEIDKLVQLADQAGNVIRNIRTFDQIYMQAYTDALTNLPNRRSFEWESQKLLTHSERYRHCFVIAMMDLNGFKRINDTYGHTTGDKVLRIIADYIQQQIRKTDLLARYGGDEFILMLPEIDPVSAAAALEKIAQSMPQCKIPISDTITESLTLSYGLAVYPQDSQDINQLITLADKNLYLNKAKIKNGKSYKG